MGTQNNVFATLVSQEVVVEEVDSYVVVTSPVIPGADGLDGSSILNGIVAPTTQGVDGDFYIDTVTLKIYGPKTAGAWGAGTDIVGTDGLDGKTILSGIIDPTTEGENGDFYLNTATMDFFGPKAGGVWPAGVSLVGPTGATGADGVDGDSGVYIGTDEPVDPDVNIWIDTDGVASDAASIAYTDTNSNLGGANDVQEALDNAGAQLAQVNGGSWLSLTSNVEYVSADDPAYTIRFNVDVTEILTAGFKIKWTQTTVRYGIIISVGPFSGGYTSVTVYGGTDYDVANDAISDFFYSTLSCPIGFPKNRSKWTITVSDNTDNAQTPPAEDTWYNATSLAIPIGLWEVRSRAIGYITRSSGTYLKIEIAISTTNNGATIPSGISVFSWNSVTNATVPFDKIIDVELVEKTTYYLNYRSAEAGSNVLALIGTVSPSTIEAICAYL